MTVIPSGVWPIDPTIVNGTELAQYLNTFVNAFNSMQSSATRPPTVAKGAVWSKTLGATDVALMFFDGGVDYEIGSIVNGISDFGGVSGSAVPPVSPADGELWVDTSDPADPVVKVYNGTEWRDVSNSFYKGNNGNVGSNIGDIFRVNSQELTSNVTIDADENASCAGPLTVNTNITLTVAVGGNLVIL